VTATTFPEAKYDVISEFLKIPKILFSNYFFSILQITLYPAIAYHSHTKTIKVIFDFGGRFFTAFQERKT